MAFILFISFVILTLIVELLHSRSNEKWLVQQGAVEYGRKHYPFIVALHALFQRRVATVADPDVFDVSIDGESVDHALILQRLKPKPDTALQCTIDQPSPYLKEAETNKVDRLFHTGIVSR